MNPTNSSTQITSHKADQGNPLLAPEQEKDLCFPSNTKNLVAPHNQEGQLPSTPPDDGQESIPPSPPPDGKPLPNVWIYDGEAYDLTEFIAKHPGGQFFIGRTKNRDITTIVNIFHPNPAKVKRVLQKYSLGRSSRAEDIHPKYNAPPFLFSPHFNGWRDTPKYEFHPDHLLTKIKTRLNDSLIKEKIAQYDRLFNIISVILFVAYLAIQWLYLDHVAYLPAYIFIPLIVILRISLAGVGHYLIHRPQVGWNKVFSSLFDINYVPLSLVVTDGHTLLHHPYTQSEVDIKKNVFTAMLELPRFYRVPIHSVHKLGHVVMGMFARIIELFLLTLKMGSKEIYGSWQLGIPHFIGSFAIHLLLLAELILFSLKGVGLTWLIQFLITLWLSTFMIVASHDFDKEETEQKQLIPIDWSKKDWAILQIENSYDLSIVGNKYLDCFLSAGLSPHRVHHVLPQQKSGFANIFSEEIVKEEAEKMGVEWLAPKNFFRDRLPSLIQHYLAVPSRIAKEEKMGLIQEHFHLKALGTTWDYMIKGLTGIGSI